ncbi:hypothetical protein [Bacillus sp. V5-8f]|uniref:hypothetical protein n=1 Tax=Bacillus sp. V5-8f TaxID=2053044 RepID=UPI000C767AA1|nr:hypothetical protein [Bacillus sp. V5-8f]PLT32614.1 hypothetical protein CUU64_18260 [Bacillus sp. V5-8f]
MNRLKVYYETTSHLLQRVRHFNQDEDWDQGIAEIESLLEERTAMLNDIAAPFSSEEREMGKKLIRMDNALNEELIFIKGQIVERLKEIRQKKVTKQKYSDPYQALVTDGIFYDRSK